MSDLAEKIRQYREERAADEDWDHDFTPSPHEPQKYIEEIARDPGGPAALIELLRVGDEQDRSYACLGLERCAARCGPEAVTALEEALQKKGTGRAAVRAIEAIDPERFWQARLHRMTMAVEEVAEMKMTRPEFPAWFSRLLHEGSPASIAALLGAMEISERLIPFDEPVLAVLRKAAQSPDPQVSGPATHLLSGLGPDEDTEQLIDAMARSGRLDIPRVAAHPHSDVLFKVCLEKGDLAALGQLLERRRCAGLPNDPEPCRALLRAKLEHPSREWRFEWFDVAHASHCAEQLLDAQLLSSLVGAIPSCQGTGIDWSCLKAALTAYGPPALAAVEGQRLESMLAHLKAPRRRALEDGDEWFLRATFDDTSIDSGSAFDSYSRVLLQRPSPHAAFQLAWIDRAFGAPVPPSRVQWIRSLGFRDEELLATVGRKVRRPFTLALRAHLKKVEPEENQRAIDAGLYPLADGHPRFKEMGERHLARVREACA